MFSTAVGFTFFVLAINLKIHVAVVYKGRNTGPSFAVFGSDMQLCENASTCLGTQKPNYLINK